MAAEPVDVPRASAFCLVFSPFAPALPPAATLAELTSQMVELICANEVLAAKLERMEAEAQARGSASSAGESRDGGRKALADSKRWFPEDFVK